MTLRLGFPAMIALLSAGLALNGEARAAGCDAAGADAVEIARVTQDLDIMLKDDRGIHLAGIQAPASDEPPHGPDARIARRIAELAAGQAVTLRPVSPIADRWGRISADLFVGGRHLQSALAEEGLVVARPDDLRGPCWEAVKTAEAKGKRDEVGIWNDPDAILSATDTAGLTARDGLFSLASGKVRHVSRGKGHGRSYVDFGPRGSNALFLTIDAKALVRMEKQGFKLEQLDGRGILVRGVVLSGRSPHMVVDDVDAVEFWE